MAWYRTGTVSVTNGSATVTGSGTNFVANVVEGEGFLGPDGGTYEIEAVVSATQLTLATPYLGSSASSQNYKILPTQSALADLAVEAAELVSTFASVRDGVGQGLFADGNPAAPAVRFLLDQDTGFFRPGANSIGVATGGQQRMRLTPTGFGIGTIAPYCELELVGSMGIGAQAGIGSIGVDLGKVYDGKPAAQIRAFIGLDDGETGVFGGDLLIGPRTSAATNIRFFTGTAVTERLRIAGDGNVGIGTATAANKLTVAGTISHAADNTHSLGTASLRASTVYAGTGTINTSDERDKAWRGDMSANEFAAGKRIIGELGFFQWNHSVEEKGTTDARLHFGVRAQAVWSIMQDCGLAGTGGESIKYGFLCYDEWPEQSEDGEVIREAGSRYGIRPDQLALFLIAVQARFQGEMADRVARLEAAA